MQPAPLATNAQAPHWKETALQRAEVITDIWEVVKAYAGRAAEWVLFLCMIANIVEMLPGASLPAFLTNAVLGIQVVMLDIGGMSLGTMASHIRERGDAEAAKKADVTSKFLIGLMILTLLLVSTGVLFPVVKSYTDMAEKGLILVRVVMTVIYSHVIHSLRDSSLQTVPVPATPALQPAVPEESINNILIPVLEQYRTEMLSEIARQMKQMSAPAIDYQQLAAALQDSVVFQNMQQAQSLKQHQKVKSQQLRQLPAPVSIEGGKQDRQARLDAAYRELLREGIKPTGQALSSRARCNRAIALSWLKQHESGEVGRMAVLENQG